MRSSQRGARRPWIIAILALAVVVSAILSWSSTGELNSGTTKKYRDLIAAPGEANSTLSTPPGVPDVVGATATVAVRPSASELPQRRSRHNRLSIPRVNASSPAELALPHVWLTRNLMPDKSLGRLRVVVVSLGGVGSTALMDSLRGALGPLGVDISDVNDKDGLKHTPYGLLSRGALAAFDPTLVLYVLGNPAAAIASHYRRGFQGSQICLLSPSAESVLAETPVLNATHFPPASNVSLFPAYASLVAETGTDYFETYAHAASWLGATELGYTVVWATLRRLVQPETQAALGQLIFGASPRAPLYDFPLRNSTSWNPRGVPAPYLTLYASIYDRLLASFDGACASSSPTQCAAAGLRPIGNTTQLNASIMDAFGFRASAISIASARRTYIRLLPGVCGAHLRPKRRVRTVSVAATAQARAASLRGLQAAQPSHAAAAVANVSVVAPEREDRQVPGGPRADSKAPIGL